MAHRLHVPSSSVAPSSPSHMLMQPAAARCHEHSLVHVPCATNTAAIADARTTEAAGHISLLNAHHEYICEEQDM